MSSFIILGDPHIGAGTAIGKIGVGSQVNSRVADQLSLLDWTLEEAIKSSSSNIIVTGDIFDDPRPSPQLISLFISWLKSCQAHEVYVHLIMGNHDMLRHGSTYISPLDIISISDMEGIFVYKDISSIKISNDVALTFVPFRDRKSFSSQTNSDALKILSDIIKYEFLEIPQSLTKIAIGHLAIEGSIPVGDEIDDITNELYCPIDMFNGYDFIYMGHVHKPQVLSKKPYVCHVGSMDISNFGETDQTKHIVIFDCETKTFQNKPLPTRVLKKLSVAIDKDCHDTTSEVMRQIATVNVTNAIVKVDVGFESNDSLPIDKQIIEKKLYELGCFNVTAISESRKQKIIKKDKTENINTSVDVMSAIKLYADINIDASKKDEFISVASEIFNSYRAGVK